MAVEIENGIFYISIHKLLVETVKTTTKELLALDIFLPLLVPEGFVYT